MQVDSISLQSCAVNKLDLFIDTISKDATVIESISAASVKFDS
jgi:hypothetical protein